MSFLSERRRRWTALPQFDIIVYIMLSMRVWISATCMYRMTYSHSPKDSTEVT